MPSKPRAAGGKGDYATLANEELISLVGDAGTIAALYEIHSLATYSLLQDDGREAGSRGSRPGRLPKGLALGGHLQGPARQREDLDHHRRRTQDRPVPEAPAGRGREARDLGERRQREQPGGCREKAPVFLSVRTPRRVVAISAARSSQPSRPAGFLYRTKDSPTGGDRFVALGRKIGHLAYKMHPCGL